MVPAQHDRSVWSQSVEQRLSGSRRHSEHGDTVSRQVTLTVLLPSAKRAERTRGRLSGHPMSRHDLCTVVCWVCVTYAGSCFTGARLTEGSGGREIHEAGSPRDEVRDGHRMLHRPMHTCLSRSLRHSVHCTAGCPQRAKKGHCTMSTIYCTGTPPACSRACAAAVATRTSHCHCHLCALKPVSAQKRGALAQVR